jgi:hypothetical protein
MSCAWYFIVILLSNGGQFLDATVAFYQSRIECSNIQQAVKTNLDREDVNYRISECQPVPEVGTRI